MGTIIPNTPSPPKLENKCETDLEFKLDCLLIQVKVIHERKAID